MARKYRSLRTRKALLLDSRESRPVLQSTAKKLWRIERKRRRCAWNHVGCRGVLLQSRNARCCIANRRQECCGAESERRRATAEVWPGARQQQVERRAVSLACFPSLCLSLSLSFLSSLCLSLSLSFFPSLSSSKALELGRFLFVVLTSVFSSAWSIAEALACASFPAFSVSESFKLSVVLKRSRGVWSDVGSRGLLLRSR